VISGGPPPPLRPLAPHTAPPLLPLGWLPLPQDDGNWLRLQRVEPPGVHWRDDRRVLFAHVDPHGRTDPQDPDDLPPPTAMERHGDARLLHRGRETSSTHP